MAVTEEGDPAEGHGGALLAHISNEVVRTLKESFGRGPERAKSYMVDDLLFVVMRGGMTVAEQTLVEAGEHDLVRSYRQSYENHMAGRLSGLIERLTGRTVITYQSQVLFEPFISIEVFVFDETPSPASKADEVVATAEGQLRDERGGEVGEG